MKTKFNGILTLFIALVVQLGFAQERVVSGVVSDETGGLPGVNVVKKGTSQGVDTDIDGRYTIKVKTGDVLVFTFVGMKTAVRKVGSSNVINVLLKSDNVLEEVVITGALGIRENTKKAAYATQVVKSEDLNVSQESNIKNAIAGKVAGVQVASQSGAKLGSSGALYLRGAISAKGREEALYVVDGVVTNSSNVDLDNVASINVLKGPNAAALYGLRAAAGVVVVTTKKGRKGAINVNLNSSVTFDNVAYLPNYQNEYGQGYNGEAEWSKWDQDEARFNGKAPSIFAVNDGKDYIYRTWADESWGPKFDGREYAPWYSWFPGTDENPNPYYGKTAKWEANEDNIRDYYNTAITLRNSVELSGGNEKLTGRLSYVNLDQTGLLPNSGLDKHIFSARVSADLSEKLTLASNVTYTNQSVDGDFDDGYSNPTSGNFNQWFARQIDVNKLRELKDLQTPDGYTVSWNWWNPSVYTRYGGGYKKPTFWYNPFFHSENVKFNRVYDRLVASADANYKLNEKLSFNLRLSRSSVAYNYSRFYDYALEKSNNAAELQYTKYLNSFSLAQSNSSETVIKPSLNYTTDLSESLKLDVVAGYINRKNRYKSIATYMKSEGNPAGGEAVGLVIPNLFNFNNSRESIIPDVSDINSEVNSLYSRIKLEYKDYLNFNFDVRNDWDSRFDISGVENTNSFLFGSVGANFIFSNLFLKESDVLNFGKVWVNYARVGTEIGAYTLNPEFRLGSKHKNIPSQYTPSSVIGDDVSPATSGSLEVGTDLRFFNNRVTLNLTYYNENRENEILNSDIPSASGNSGLIANAGKVNRKGIEAILGFSPVSNENFKWDVTLNFAKNKTVVKALAKGSQSYELGSPSFGQVTLLNRVGKEWGQLEGNKIKRDKNGTPIIGSNGLYETVANQSYGSVLPDFNGGIYNRLSYKGLSLAATISFQKGGKFYSLSEMWGNYSGLLEETAGLNNLGNPKRNAVADGGGVHVVGVDKDGKAVDKYVEATDYFHQFRSNDLPEPFVHDASYIKLSDISFTYSLPKNWFNNSFKSVQVGVIARNVGLLYLSDDNKNGWDPSEMSKAYGENGQLPGTRSYGFNVKLGF